MQSLKLASKSAELASKVAKLASKSAELASKVAKLASKSAELASKVAKLASNARKSRETAPITWAKRNFLRECASNTMQSSKLASDWVPFHCRKGSIDRFRMGLLCPGRLFSIS
ncbi:hypothetical protein [Peribacillus muralis]|uniref:hypothetical protein n=1 Tax=Peribacillus muralis TaxID=264697 RepID=UPI003D03048D